MASGAPRGEFWVPVYSVNGDLQRPHLTFLQQMLSEKGIPSEIVSDRAPAFRGMDQSLQLHVPEADFQAASEIVNSAQPESALTDPQWEESAPWREALPQPSEAETREAAAKAKETVREVSGWELSATEEWPSAARITRPPRLARYWPGPLERAVRAAIFLIRLWYALPVCALVIATLVNPMGLFDVKVWIAVAIFIVFQVLPLRWLGNRLERWTIRRSAKRRNRFARELTQALMEGRDVPRFAIYLRPFDVDLTLGFGNPNHSAIPFALSHYLVSRNVDFETVLSDALVHRLPLLGLGCEYKDFYGAGRIEVPDSVWRSVVSSLMDQAALIVLVPSPTRSTVWEMLQVHRRKLLHKVVFAYPNTAAAKERALEAAAMMKEIGLAQPVIDATDGLLLWRTDYSGNIPNLASASRISPYILRALLSEVNAPGLGAEAGGSQAMSANAGA